MFLRSLALAGLALLAFGPRASGAAPAPIAHRVVSLIPSLTEDLFAVGAGASVVGVSAYSDFPPQARRLPVVATFASVNTERIVALHPDVVVAIEAQHDLGRDIARVGIPMLYFRDDSLEDVYANLRSVGRLVGRAAAADALVARLRTRTARLTSALPARPGARPSVFVVLGTAPVFTIGKGSYITNLIALAGGRNAASDIDAPYARYSAEALVARQPDVLIVDPDVHLGDVLSRAPWNALRAVREHRVYTLPDASILERPGPRYNDGLAWLIDTLRKSQAPVMDRAQEGHALPVAPLRGRIGGPAQSAGGAGFRLCRNPHAKRVGASRRGAAHPPGAERR